MVIQLLLILTLILIITLLNSRIRKESFQNPPISRTSKKMGLYSHRLYNNGPLHPRYTCKGTTPGDLGDISPDFYWRNLPSGTSSLAIIMEDTTNSNKITHWIIWNIMNNSELEENDKSKLIGLNDFDYQGYTAPCKDNTTKQFTFTLYALDILNVPNLNTQTTRKNDLLIAIRDHILETATLVVYL